MLDKYNPRFFCAKIALNLAKAIVMPVKYDLTKMIYPVHEIGSKNPVDVYPDLQNIKYFSDSNSVVLPLTHKIVVKWILLMFDPGSPAANMNTLPEKKKFVRDHIDVLFHAKLEEAFQEMENFKIPSINRMCLYFLFKTQRDIYTAEYTMMFMSKLKLQQEILENPTKSNVEALTSLNNHLSALHNNILGRVHSIKLEEELNKIVIDEQLSLNPIDLIVDYQEGKTIHPEFLL